MSVRSRIHRVDPYQGFPCDDYKPHFEGFGSDDPVFAWAIEALKPALILEVGTWKGGSAITMAEAARDLRLATEIVCIDTWLGSPEHILAYKDDWYTSLLFRNGFPHIYYTFLANVLNKRLDEFITPFPATSENAAYILGEWGVTASLIYIDGAHEYKSVARDLVAYWDLLSDGGLLLADDYVWWPGVTRAVDEFIASRHLQDLSILRNGKAVLSKGESAAFDRLWRKTAQRGWLDNSKMNLAPSK